jgi:hypothetical protein
LARCGPVHQTRSSCDEVCVGVDVLPRCMRSSRMRCGFDACRMRKRETLGAGRDIFSICTPPHTLAKRVVAVPLLGAARLRRRELELAQVAVHPLVPTVVLRAARPRAHQAHAERKQPDGQLRQPATRVHTDPRSTVVALDRERVDRTAPIRLLALASRFPVNSKRCRSIIHKASDSLWSIPI